MTTPDERFLWRVSDHIDLSGAGGLKSGARWHTKGSPIVYTADSPMAALVETLVHLEIDSEDIPDAYTLLKIAVPASLAMLELDISSVTDWKANPSGTRRSGDKWLASLETPSARVPSVFAPYTWNHLLNPRHPQASQIKIIEVIKERFDTRLFRLGLR